MDEYKVQSRLKNRASASFILEQAEYTDSCEYQKIEDQDVEKVDSRYFEIEDAPPITEEEFLSQNIFNGTMSFLDILNDKTED